MHWGISLVGRQVGTQEGDPMTGAHRVLMTMQGQIQWCVSVP